MRRPIQTITTSSGDELVVLDRADYEDLVARAEVEDDSDIIAIADARMNDPDVSARLPSEVSRYVLAGASVLKALRQWRDVGQVKLALDIGTSQGFVSDIENGRRVMTDEVRQRIAAALDVPPAWLASSSSP